MQIKYKLFPRPLDGDGETILKIEKKFGAIGYVYRGRIDTVTNGTLVKTFVYINIDNSKAPYQLRAFAGPSTPADFLKQLSEQGAQGFRYDSGLDYKTGQYYEYIRDTSRPSAKYIYRYEPCMNSSDELFVQINKNAAQGYRVLDIFTQDNRCLLYIKDTSKHFKFVYKMVPDFNTTAELLPRANQLGAQGYHYAGNVYADLMTEGYTGFSTLPLYYRDTTQKSCTFSYSSAPVPDSPAKALALLQKQEANGFLYAVTYDTLNDSSLIFVKYQNCRYKGLNIDALY